TMAFTFWPKYGAGRKSSFYGLRLLAPAAVFCLRPIGEIRIALAQNFPLRAGFSEKFVVAPVEQQDQTGVIRFHERFGGDAFDEKTDFRAVGIICSESQPDVLQVRIPVGGGSV